VPEVKSASSELFMKKELKGSKVQLFIAIVLMFIVTFWHSYSTINVHQEYQNSLMDSISNRIIDDVEHHFLQLRLEINEFQWRHQALFLELQRQGNDANKNDYMELLKLLRSEIKGVRLFSFVDSTGKGLFEHITGDFSPDCKEEIDSIITQDSQENLFFHRTASSVHYDILEPLIGAKESMYLFVAFNPKHFEMLLKRHRLPQQDLFLLRKDTIGKVELAVSGDEDSSFDNIVMSESEVNEFSFFKAIPRTRWNIAIRLQDQYNEKLINENYLRSFLIWALISLILIVGYISKRRRSINQFEVLQQLKFVESHDTLTGLMNRDSVVSYYQKIKDNIEEGRGVAMMIDLDKFQMFNNSIGFSKGDLCLCMISDSLQKCLPKSAKFARISNDQFVVLIPDLEHGYAGQMAELLRKKVQELDFSSIAVDISMTCCVGIVVLNSDFVDGEHVMSSLVLSIQLAKYKGTNNIQHYQSDNPELLRHAEEMNIFKTVKCALSENKFMLYRQELRKASIESSQKVYEVLLRLVDKAGNMISPAVFISVAEQHSLAVELDKWVITRTLRQMSIEQSGDHYCINLSGQTLAENSMVDFVRDKIKEFDIATDLITFEITETFAITHLASAIHFISEITSLGCRFALDDFGSGLSSFSYLQQLPVQKLKIDGIFVKDITNNPRNQAFVSTMVSLAQSMDMETVAEFVETENEYEMLSTLGLDYFQGYYFHKPEPWVH